MGRDCSLDRRVDTAEFALTIRGTAIRLGRKAKLCFLEKQETDTVAVLEVLPQKGGEQNARKS